MPPDDLGDELGLASGELGLAYQRLLDNLPDAVLVHDVNGRIVLVNQRFEALFDYSRAELVSGSLDVVFPGGLPHRAEVSQSAYRERSTTRVAGADGEVLGRRKDGTELALDISVSPIALSGHELTTAVIRAAPPPQGAQERAYFVSSLSHDLAQPLTVVSGTIQLLQRLIGGGLPPTVRELQEQLAILAAAAGSAAALAAELLDLSRSAAGHPSALVFHPFDLVGLVEEEARLRQATGQVHFEVQTETPQLIIEGDRARLRRVVANLLANAVSYSPQGRQVRIEVEARDEGRRRWAVLMVADRGLGIPAADLPYVFDRFYRGANVAGRSSGSGLGLALAKQTVEQHGGEISVTSVEGIGTTVTVRLPLD
jgi:PAS domain S-box-containing protein